MFMHRADRRAVIWALVGLLAVLLAGLLLTARADRPSIPASGRPVRRGPMSSSCTLYPSADAHVNSGAPKENYGGASTLLIGQSGGFAAPPTRRDGLLRFDLGGIPASAVLESASLQLYLLRSASDGPYVMTLHALESAWAEHTVTWGSHPGLSADYDIINVTEDTGYQSWDVTDLVREWLSQKRTNNGLGLRAGQPAEFGLYFASREYDRTARDPCLVLTYTVPTATPTPSPTPTRPPEERPDLIITDVWPEKDRICYQILNQGASSAPKGHVTALSINDRMVDADEIDVELKPQERLNRCFSYGWRCTPPQDIIEVHADARESIVERDESNNSQQETWLCDTAAPLITEGPTVLKITQNSAVVSWGTNESCNGLVRYGRYAGAYEQQRGHEAFSTKHEVQLSSLEPTSLYHFCVESTDASGNEVISREGFFETASPPDGEPPSVSELSFGRLEGAFQRYRMSAVVSDTIGVERVEFYLDDELVGTDYAPSSPVYECHIDPFAMGLPRESFFTEHTFTVKAFDHAGLSNTRVDRLTPPGEAMQGELRLEAPEPGYKLYVDGDVAPPGSQIGILAYAVEYEWQCVLDMLRSEIRGPSGQPSVVGAGAGESVSQFDYPVYQGMTPFGQDLIRGWQVERSVAAVAFYIDDTLVYTSTPSSEDDFYHSYLWDVSGLALGPYKVAVRAYDREGREMYRSRYIEIARGTPTFDVNRTVTRVGNYLQVTLAISNEGTIAAGVDLIEDNVYGFQPIRTDTAPGQTPAYRVRTAASLDATHCDVNIDLHDGASQTITLAPGESLSVDYEIVPVLYPNNGWPYAVGPYDLIIHYVDGSGEHEVGLARPCYATSGGEVNPVTLAQNAADYLLVTCPARLVFLNPDREDVERLLSAMAELALLKNGVLGYLVGPESGDPITVDTWITQWGAIMRGSDGLANNYLCNGYLLLVGETEIVPARNWKKNAPWYASWAHEPRIDPTDVYYAQTSGNLINPELIVGRIVGNDAEKLVIPLRTSINVARNAPGWTFDRSHALILSGWPECRGGGCDSIDFAKEASRVESRLVGKGTLVSRIDTTNYFSATVSMADFFALTPNRDIIHLAGHGNVSVCDDLGTGSFTLADPFGNANPFVYASSCLTGLYTGGTSLAEKFLEKGAAVYLGATEVSYCCVNTKVAKKFYDRWDAGESIGSVVKQLKVTLARTTGNTRRTATMRTSGRPSITSMATPSMADRVIRRPRPCRRPPNRPGS